MMRVFYYACFRNYEWEKWEDDGEQDERIHQGQFVYGNCFICHMAGNVPQW